MYNLPTRLSQNTEDMNSLHPPTYYAVFLFDNECGMWPVEMSIKHYADEPTPIQIRLEVSPTWKMLIPLKPKEAIALKKELETAIELQVKPKK